MNHKSAIAQLLRKVKMGQALLHDRQIIHPQRDWTIGVIVGFLIVVTSGLWSAQKYTSNRDVEMQTTAVESSVVYRKQLVNDVLNIYAAKAENYSQLLQTTPGPIQIIEPAITASSSATTTPILSNESSSTTDLGIATSSASSSVGE